MGDFSLESQWLWNHWTCTYAGCYHMFYMKAAKNIAPDQRYEYARLGHATSIDLKNWVELPDALTASYPHAFDDGGIDSGFIVEKPAGGWRLFYTGYTRKNNSIISAISWADSDDGVHFAKGKANIISPDDRWYHTGSEDCPDVIFKHPYIYHYGGMWHMVFVAQPRDEVYLDTSPADSAVIGYATSPDMEIWLQEPPMIPRDLFKQMELPRVVNINGASRLVVTAEENEEKSTWIIPGESMLGPWKIENKQRIEYPKGTAGCPLKTLDDTWIYTSEANGEISEPIPWQGLLFS